VILAWQWANGEDTLAWLTFLTRLEEHGLRGENGLQLIIHDGGDGLWAALQIVHFDPPSNAVCSISCATAPTPSNYPMA